MRPEATHSTTPLGGFELEADDAGDGIQGPWLVCCHVPGDPDLCQGGKGDLRRKLYAS